MIFVSPENRPLTPDAVASLDHTAADISDIYASIIAASDAAVLEAAEHGLELAPHPALDHLLELEADLNRLAADHKRWEEVLGTIETWTPEELAEALPELRERFPDINFVDFYARNRKREPGVMGRMFRPVLRALDLVPPWWK
jgi:hypothetical protein